MADRNIRKTRVGKVVSNKMQKTIVVVIQDSIRHRIYNKIVKSSVRLKVHDENNECSVGDRVRITETRPISKEKRWRVSGVLEKAK
ncbi:MAG: 30S ribosomal protein S17 [Oscillospiraceae bacterium]|nr:30S ribosomal protein S17 [Oscillospiraceae bacterium]